GGRGTPTPRLSPKPGETTWDGHANGRLLRPGTYTLEVGALDLAGNSTPPTERRRVHVRSRYIALAARRITVRAGSRFEIGVSTDAVRYRWQLGARKGRKGGHVLPRAGAAHP